MQQLMTIVTFALALAVCMAPEAHAQHLQRIGPYKKPSAQKAEKKASSGAKATKSSTKKLSKKRKGASQADDGLTNEERKNLKRDMVFSGSNVNGKYLVGGEGLATVETEKELNKLVGMRRDFKDRLAAEKTRLQAESK